MDLPGKQHRGLINGYDVTDIEITGENGVIDGQGSIWWQWLNSHKLNYSRPHLVEFVNSTAISISSLMFLNAPAWAIHPVYCSDVMVRNVTIIIAPNSRLTDGIVVDSCSKMCIEDCAISVGHDAISLKSGWDRYGISTGKPTSDIKISRVHLQSSAGCCISVGSEMSGGISNIRAENLSIRDSATGISFQTTLGRGGYIKEIAISEVWMENVVTAVMFSGQSGGHPDDQYDPTDVPAVNQITLTNIVGVNVSSAGVLSGIPGDPFTNICFSNLQFVHIPPSSSASWVCSDISGYSELVSPEACPELNKPYSKSSLCFSPNYSPLATA